MDPCVWGPALWHFLHIISFNYPEVINSTNQNVKNETISFMNSLGQVLPCDVCKEHYLSNLYTLTVDGKNLFDCLNSRTMFIRWMYELHKLVNIQTGKPEGPDYNTVYNKFSKLNTGAACGDSCGDGIFKCTVEIVPKNNNYMWFYIIIGLIMIALGYKYALVKKII